MRMKKARVCGQNQGVPAAAELRKLTAEEKNAILIKIADTLEAKKAVIFSANAEDAPPFSLCITFIRPSFIA